MRKVFDHFKKPPIIARFFIYLLLVTSLVVSMVILNVGESGLLEAIIFGVLGTIFAYSLYMLIAYDFKNIVRLIKSFYHKIIHKHKVIENITVNYELRTIVSTSFSFVVSVGFAIYNAFAGIYYHSIWHASISVYYILLIGLRIMVLFMEYKLYKNKANMTDSRIKRRKMYIRIGMGLTLVNIALIFPIIELQMFHREVKYTKVLAIVLATYTFYKVGMSISNFIKSRSSGNLSVKGLRNINFADAMVSILSLENTMLMVFSNEEQNGMMVLSAISGAVITVSLVVLSIMTIAQGVKEKEKIYVRN